MNKQDTVTKWVPKINPSLMEVNRLLREMVAEDGILPEIYVVQDPKRLGKGVQMIEITILSNPHYSDWTKLHIDFCRRFPKANAFAKWWKPTKVIVQSELRMWWFENITMKFLSE